MNLKLIQNMKYISNFQFVAFSETYINKNLNDSNKLYFNISFLIHKIYLIKTPLIFKAFIKDV